MRINNSQHGYVFQQQSENSVAYWPVPPGCLLIQLFNLFSRPLSSLDTHVVMLITAPIVLISKIPTKLNILITFTAGVTALLSGIHAPRVWMQRARSWSQVLVSKACNASRNKIFHFVDEWAKLAGKMKVNLSKRQRNGIKEKSHYSY